MTSAVEKCAGFTHMRFIFVRDSGDKCGIHTIPRLRANTGLWSSDNRKGHWWLNFNIVKQSTVAHNATVHSLFEDNKRLLEKTFKFCCSFALLFCCCSLSLYCCDILFEVCSFVSLLIFSVLISLQNFGVLDCCEKPIISALTKRVSWYVNDLFS